MSNAKILVADDELDVISMVSMRLEAHGYDVITAIDGCEAIKVAIREKPDAIILDIGMPSGDGHVVADCLKGSAETRSIPIIFLTARTSIEDQQRAFEEGVEKYVTKPFDSQELILALDDALHCSNRTHGQSEIVPGIANRKNATPDVQG